jgi:hypothetical protein
MLKISSKIALVAAFAAFAPLAAQAASSHHDGLVQGINDAYGTSFPVHSQPANTAANHNSKAQNQG